MSIIVITGANSGIGFGASLNLAHRGHEIIMICRNPEKAKKAREKVIQETDNENIHIYEANLSQLDSITQASSLITNDFDHIDILVNNAGVILTNLEVTHVGLEKTLAVNHLGHFLLTDQLLPLLSKAESARIINTSSGAHRGGSFDFNDINYENTSYSTFGAYSRSKLANILFTKSLDEKFDKTAITVYSLHPGFVGSNFAKNNGILAKIAMFILKPFAKSIHSGAQPIIFLATEEGIEHKSGGYFVDKNSLPFTSAKIEIKSTIKASNDTNLQNKLWNLSESYVKKWNEEYEFNYNNYS